MGADRAIHIKTDMRTDQELQPLAVRFSNFLILTKTNFDKDSVSILN